MKLHWLIAVLGLVLIGFAPTGSAAQQVTDLGPGYVDTINAIRAKAGRSPLKVSAALTKAAAGHVRDMAANNFFSHTGSDGSRMSDRARRVGYGFCHIAENIGAGYPSVDAALKGWMDSPPHRKNMLSPNVTELGFVRTPGLLWVILLGKPGC